MDYDATHRDSVNDTKGRCHVDSALHDCPRPRTVYIFLSRPALHLSCLPHPAYRQYPHFPSGHRSFVPMTSVLSSQDLPPAPHLRAAERTASTAPLCYIAHTELPKALVKRVAVICGAVGLGLGDVAARQPVPATPSRLLPRLPEFPILLGTPPSLHFPSRSDTRRPVPNLGRLGRCATSRSAGALSSSVPSVDGKPPRVLAPPVLRKSMIQPTDILCLPSEASKRGRRWRGSICSELATRLKDLSSEDATVAIVYFSNACCHDREDDLHPSSSALVVFFCTGCTTRGARSGMPTRVWSASSAILPCHGLIDDLSLTQWPGDPAPTPHSAGKWLQRVSEGASSSRRIRRVDVARVGGGGARTEAREA
ncbi:hypothetical protein B0H14DRAFT_3860292, partial [Mycena olivaceomarginata]